jgi:hypothetical protein
MARTSRLESVVWEQDIGVGSGARELSDGRHRRARGGGSDALRAGLGRWARRNGVLVDVVAERGRGECGCKR